MYKFSVKEKREKMIFNTIDYKFKDAKLLEQAFTSPSAIKNKISSLNESYQRLEFLGDAILKMVITELIYQIYPNYNEGQLTKKREELEKNKALSIISQKMGLLEFVIRCKSEKFKSKLEADLIEAIIGAIMIDSNYNYKITRYHTLLLISENVLKDIDLELFFEYVAKCKSEMLGSTYLKEDTFNIEQNKKDQFSGKNTEIHDKDKENNNVVIKDEKKFNNRVSNNKSLIIINDEINKKDLENTQIKDEKGSNKIKIKEFDDINKFQENIDHNKNLNLEYSLYEDINNYAFDD
jgi:dsRNA-specific ribonuclease